MSTNLSGNTLTLGSTSLDENTLKKIINGFYIPDNCKVGDTVILEGIECACVATGVTMYDTNLTRVAVDKNYNLEHYQQYVGTNMDGAEITQTRYWRWGSHGTYLNCTSYNKGFGLRNTNNCLSNPAVYTGGAPDNNTYPLMWKGVYDFRLSHSDKWFVPSADELKQFIYYNKKYLSGDFNFAFWSSSEQSLPEGKWSWLMNLGNNYVGDERKYKTFNVRLCRVF